MWWKTIVGALALAALTGAFFYGRYYDYLGQHWLRLFVPANNQTLPNEIATTTGVGYTTLLGMTVVSISTSQITVTDAANQNQTFSLSKDIPVFSLVAPGEVGKGFGDIRVGSMVTLYRSKLDPTQLVGMAFARDHSLDLTQEEVAHSIAGDIVAVDTASVTIKPTNGTAPVTIVRDATSRAVATVVGGQTGFPMTVGNHIIASGVKTTDGKVTAKLLVYGEAK